MNAAVTMITPSEVPTDRAALKSSLSLRSRAIMGSMALNGMFVIDRRRPSRK
jgi:hypothetical protein